MPLGFPSYKNQLKGALQSVKRGQGTGVGAIMRNAREIENAERAKGDDYFSKYCSRRDRIDFFVGKNGQPTTSYPHVHVVHNDSESGIRVIASKSSGNHPWETTLPLNAGGNDVNNAIKQALRHL